MEALGSDDDAAPRERAAPRRAAAATTKKVVDAGSSDEDEDSEAISEVITLEATQGQIEGFFGQLPFTCRQNRVAFRVSSLIWGLASAPTLMGVYRGFGLSTCEQTANPPGGVRPFYQNSTCYTYSTPGPCVLHIW